MSSSAIFEGYRALGLVSNHVPFIVRYHHKVDDIRIITSAGRSFHSYDSRLRLIESSHEHDSEITCMESDSVHVFTSAGCHIYAWKHGHRWLHNTYGGHKATVKIILPFGPHIISIDEDSLMVINEIRSGKFVSEIPFAKGEFEVTSIMHPATYLNKIVLGSKQGRLKLINVKSLEVVYEFNGWGSSVQVLEQSPAVDVVGIGLENGLIVIHNLKFDETLMKFRQEWSTVKALSFRTDGPPHLVSTSSVGHAVIWDLEKQKICQQMRNIHSGPIEGAKYLVDEPLLVTSSSDNSLRVWSFNDYEEDGRLLHEREGHSEPPTCSKFYGPKGNHVLSSGLDSTLRCYSTLSERLNRNFGYASYNRKYAKKVGAKRDPNQMPPITSFSSEETRGKEWDNIAAIHEGLSMVTTWTYEKARMGDHKLVPKKDTPGNVATCVVLTACGNFVLIGYKDGSVNRFNMQSGLHRLAYGSPKAAHECSVSGVATDELNQIVISCSHDKSLKLWTFNKGILLATIDVGAIVTKLVMNRENSLIAIALENHRVKIIDLETKRVVRSLPSHKSDITDATFSPDGKWLIVSTADKHIRTWDLPRSKLVDKFLVKKKCRSLDMSPTGEFLVTSHEDDLAVYLWSNLTLFNPVSLRPLNPNDEALVIEFPHVRADEIDSDQPRNFTVEQGDQNMPDTVEYKSPDQISKELVTLSLQPTSRWKNLVHIDIIKKRNKPKDPPKAPEAAPFFLPTVAALKPSLDIPVVSTDNSDKMKTMAKLRGMSKFGELLLDCFRTGDYEKIFEELKVLGPSAIDAELRCLDILMTQNNEDGSDEEKPLLLKFFLSAVKQRFQLKTDFELVQSYLSLFLKIHSETLMKNPELTEELQKLEEESSGTWESLDDQMNKSLCVVNFLRSAVI